LRQILFANTVECGPVCTFCGSPHKLS